MRAFHLLVAIWMKESAIDLCSIEILMQSNLSVICDRLQGDRAYIISGALFQSATHQY
ncbi:MULTISPECIES: hypothetical protein [unclassified Microcoleus]|uniref:hypothetical protein n=1 Tax=unclassified Microcoleus TaxID=2642155 RepID=UPI0025D20650|nr:MULTISPECIES: hypothetical protein [unclassified Microcoleus]